MLLPRMLAIVILLSATALSARAQDASAKDLKLMQGSWHGEVIEAGGGKPSDKEKEPQVKVVVKGDKYTVFFNDMKYTEGTLKLDASQKPKAIDATPSDGPFKDKVQPGIYEITGDEMKIVFAKPGDERPKEFKTRMKSADVLIQYKRIKDAKK